MSNDNFVLPKTIYIKHLNKILDCESWVNQKKSRMILSKALFT